MDIGFRLPQGPVDPVELAERAEALGYSSVWAGELWGVDAFVTLARVAAATDRLGLGTAIVNVYSRTPAALAMAAATLADAGGGRVHLGLGASTERAIEGLHGLAFDRPVRRSHETAAIVRRVLGGDEPVSYDGEVLSVGHVPPLDADVGLYNAALGPANRRATGRVFDGWLPHNLPLDDLDAAFETVAEAARGAGRDPDDIRVAPYVPTAVAADEATAREQVRAHLAYYVGSGAGYRRAVATRFPDEAATIAERWAEGERDRATRAVTEAMVDALGIAGTPETARDRFLALGDRASLDEPLVVPAGTPDADRVWRTLEAIAPDG
ncbi:MAG: LLM class flavin-dependent oxidoreductase [Halobacteriales archaeon]|nr:LLM class flavin-dependent oxidoreductase [Halobacteriales archaeon]